MQNPVIKGYQNKFVHDLDLKADLANKESEKYVSNIEIQMLSRLKTAYQVEKQTANKIDTYIQKYMFRNSLRNIDATSKVQNKAHGNKFLRTTSQWN